MLTIIFAILVAVWLFGMVASYTLGGFLHVLLVVAIGVFLAREVHHGRPAL